jgi:hypothetical protein
LAPADIATRNAALEELTTQVKEGDWTVLVHIEQGSASQGVSIHPSTNLIL